jgi:hypothetical protein
MPVPLLSHRGAVPSASRCRSLRLAVPFPLASRCPRPAAPPRAPFRAAAPVLSRLSSCSHILQPRRRDRWPPPSHPPYIMRSSQTSPFSRIVCAAPTTPSAIQPLRPPRLSRNSNIHAPSRNTPVRARAPAPFATPTSASTRRAPHAQPRARSPTRRQATPIIGACGDAQSAHSGPLCPERISVIADPYSCRISAASPPA